MVSRPKRRITRSPLPVKRRRAISDVYKLIALGIGLCLLALLAHPAPAHAPALAAFVLLPVVLFGLILVPRSLWPCCDLEQALALEVRTPTTLFQRPPPKP